MVVDTGFVVVEATVVVALVVVAIVVELPVPDGVRMKVTMESPGALPLMTAPLILAVAAVGFPPLDCWLTKDVTAPKVPPETEIETVWAVLAVLITWTETVPSVFLNALVRRDVKPEVVATRTAPGRT